MREYPTFSEGVWDIANTTTAFSVLEKFAEVSYFNNLPDNNPLHFLNKTNEEIENCIKKDEEKIQLLYDHIKKNEILHSFWLL